MIFSSEIWMFANYYITLPHNLKFILHLNLTTMAKYDIFISYRREGGREHAKSIQLALEKNGYQSIFFDFDSIRDGVFNEQIIDAIKGSKDFILILSKNSMDRCSNAGDWVAKEIKTALDSGCKIIPLAIDDYFTFPVDFPQKMHELCDIQQTRLLTDSYFDDSIKRLIERLDSIPQNKVFPSTGAEIHVKSDYDCQVYDYSRLLPTTIKANEDNIITLKAGDHDLKFVSCDLPDLSVEIEYYVRSNDSVAKINVSWTKWKWEFDEFKRARKAMERKKEQQKQEEERKIIEAKKAEELNHLKQALPSECVLKLGNKYSFRMKLSTTKKYYYIEEDHSFKEIWDVSKEFVNFLLNKQIKKSDSKDNKKEMVEILDRIPYSFYNSEACKQIEKKYGIHFRKGSLAGIIQGSSRPCLILHLNNNKEFFQSLIKQNTK